jgi:hypothetical protein
VPEGSEPDAAPPVDATAQPEPASVDTDAVDAQTAPAAAGETADAIESVSAVEVSPEDVTEPPVPADPTGSAGSDDAGPPTPE